MSEIREIQRSIARDLASFEAYFREILTVPSSALGVILRYVLRSRGKQLRPMLVFLAAGATGGIRETTRVAAAMVELLHNASLLHDDVVDRADLRRGMPSVARIWKAQGAVLTGDYMLALGLRLAVETGQYELLDILNTAVQLMSVGELEQMQRARRQQVDREGYFRIIRGKTAALLAACTQAGAFSAGAEPGTVELLRQVGENLGMAFQIQDDILDYTSSPGLGKPHGNDLREGKITLPALLALEQLAPGDRTGHIRLLHQAKRNAQARAKALDFVRNSQGLAQAKEQVNRFTTQAREFISQLEPSPYRESLDRLAILLTSRQK